MSITEKVTAIIAEHCEGPGGEPDVVVTEDSRLDSLGLDSLALLEIIFEIEEELGIELPFDASNQEEYADVTVGDMIRRVEAMMASK